MTFNKQPSILAAGNDLVSELGWTAISNRIHQELKNNSSYIVVLECYQGVFIDELLSNLTGFDNIIRTSDHFKSEDEILDLTFPDVTDDRVFGKISKLTMNDFLNGKSVDGLKDSLNSNKQKTLLIGPGASLISPSCDLLVYADMARWEIQLRMRQNLTPNLGLSNETDLFERQYKIAYFVDWRACDELKKELMLKWDFVLDTNKPNEPKLVTGESITTTLKSATNQPFSVVPFFDPGPWGGQWMKEVCDLDKEKDNFAWCFNCVPEENSLLIKYENATIEIPSINLVFQEPEALLGKNVYDRFGAEFPIRFDFLDTIEGGSLSLQVHPLTSYIKEHFDMDYTQDESYYIMDASDDAKVYLGLKDNVNQQNMIDDLKMAQESGNSFDADKYAMAWPAKKHDHFLIPAGTVHCSGEGCMVLEISATPYIFTFKLWDWGRVGLDGKPRPININHGEKVIQWDRTPDWTSSNLINNIEEISQNGVSKEERTGLHELEFIETRRIWFNSITEHNTEGTVHVLCLVEGESVIVESPDEAFEPFLLNYAEVFIVPARVGNYTIRPKTETNSNLAIVKAYVR